MDLLTFTLMVADTVRQAKIDHKLAVTQWDWQTWTSPDNGLWIDVNPSFPLKGRKYNMEGNPWKW